jgi:hypothetical protein
LKEVFWVEVKFVNLAIQSFGRMKSVNAVSGSEIKNWHTSENIAVYKDL